MVATKKDLEHFIHLGRYPDLFALKMNDPEKFEEHMHGMLELGNRQLNAGFNSKYIFNMSLTQFCELMLRIFYDWKGIPEQHFDPEEAEALKMLQEDNHPLQVFQGKAKAYDAQGNEITKEQFTTAQTVEDFIKGIMYSLRFGSQKDLVKYLMLDDEEGLNNLRSQNINALLKVQPALNFQKKMGIPLASRIKNTGFFELGSFPRSKVCHACSGDNIYEAGKHIFCRDCKGAYEVIS